jgi:hypothetical protein
MFMLASVLLIALQAAAPGADSSDQQQIIVTGDNRVVCRRITRTATRMRVGRICRTLSAWTAENGARAANDPNAAIDGAADTIELLGKEHGTGDGEPGGHNGPHGPR